jgi:hypothetical protein
VTLTTLVCGARASVREAAIADAIDASCTTALILEGLPDGTTPFAPFDTAANLNNLQVARIAPGCLCCIGNLTMRVTLNRILRHPPARLFISLATASHLEQIRSFLLQAPYNQLLALTKDVQL